VRERKKKEKNQDKRTTLNKKQNGKTKTAIFKVILSSGEEYENYTHTFQTKPIL